MKRFQLRYILLAVTALGLLVWGAAVTIPNSFTDGDVISAGDMNANFTAVETAVNNNESDIATNGSDIAALQAAQVGAAQSVDAGAITVNTTTSSLASVAVSAPAAGYVLVITSAEMIFNHTNGTLSNMNYGVSEVGTTYDNDQDKDVTIPSAAPSGSYTLTTSAQKIFPVTAGAHTFYAVGDRPTTTTVTISDITLSAVFIPTSVGTVSQASLAPASVEAE